MPTPAVSPPEIHRNRQVAESFGTDPGRYDRTRPTYPTALIERIIAASPGRDVLDVGIGTGISARLFQAAGCRVLGVEADERMARFARNAGTDVEVATIEAWDPAGRSFDAVVAGQAWHWVESVAGAAKVAEVLRPGGRFAAFWNVHELAPEVASALAEAFRRHVPEVPAAGANAGGKLLDAYLGFCEKIGQSLRAADSAFGEPETWRFDWEKTYTRDELLDLVPTFGGMTLLSPERLGELLAGLGAALDALGGGFVTRYTTAAVTAARLPSSPVREEPDAPSVRTVAAGSDNGQHPTPEV
jgi:SAM-dependent methyltransferase